MRDRNVGFHSGLWSIPPNFTYELARGVQSMFPLVSVYLPRGQEIQVFIRDDGPYRPTSQVTQVFAPSVFVYFPAGHDKQVRVRIPIDCAGAAAVYVPG